MGPIASRGDRSIPVLLLRRGEADPLSSPLSSLLVPRMSLLNNKDKLCIIGAHHVQIGCRLKVWLYCMSQHMIVRYSSIGMLSDESSDESENMTNPTIY